MTDITEEQLRDLYKLVPSILKDMEEKQGKKLEFGVYTINVCRKGDSPYSSDIKVIIMPDYTGIIDDNENLICVFYVDDDEVEVIPVDDNNNDSDSDDN